MKIDRTNIKGKIINFYLLNHKNIKKAFIAGLIVISLVTFKSLGNDNSKGSKIFAEIGTKIKNVLVVYDLEEGPKLFYYSENDKIYKSLNSHQEVQIFYIKDEKQIIIASSNIVTNAIYTNNIKILTLDYCPGFTSLNEIISYKELEQIEDKIQEDYKKPKTLTKDTN